MSLRLLLLRQLVHVQLKLLLRLRQLLGHLHMLLRRLLLDKVLRRLLLPCLLLRILLLQLLVLVLQLLVLHRRQGRLSAACPSQRIN